MLAEGNIRTDRIAELNDNVRKGLDADAKIVVTRTCHDMFAGDDPVRAIAVHAAIRRAVAVHDFASDAHGERDFGAFVFRGERLFFKIDLYDETFVKRAAGSKFYVGSRQLFGRSTPRLPCPKAANHGNSIECLSSTPSMSLRTNVLAEILWPWLWMQKGWIKP